MSQPTCPDLVSFIDGEMERANADQVRDHLKSCEACRVRLLREMQLDARLSELAPEQQDELAIKVRMGVVRFDGDDDQ